jgi:hypothetical protein
MFHIRGLDWYKYWYLSDHNAETEDSDAYSWQVPAVAAIRLHAFSRSGASKSGLCVPRIQFLRLQYYIFSKYVYYFEFLIHFTLLSELTNSRGTLLIKVVYLYDVTQ